jgi:drug/metabolite transporter (DMT)-like permease
MRSPFLVLTLAVVFVSFGSIFVRLAEAPPLAVAFYRVALASLVLLPFVHGQARRSWRTLGPKRLALLAVSGLALALHFAAWIASLSHTSVASSVLLVNTAPVFAVILARIFLGERVGGALLAAISLALTGALVLGAGDWAGSRASLRGNALALAGALTLAAYHVIGRGLRAALPLGAYVLGVWAVAALALAALVFASGVPLAPYPPRAWACFALLALVPTLGGHGLVNAALRELPAPTVGLFLLGEPVGAALLAWGLLAEPPTPWTLAGGGIVLLALALIVARRT